jgi:hypothetical protein
MKMIRHPRRLWLAAALVLTTACSLSTVGLLGTGGEDAGADATATPDGSRPSPDGTVGDDGSADVAIDAALEAGRDCGSTYNPQEDAGYLVARMLPPDASITVNGALDDWECVPFVPLNATSAAIASGTGNVSGEFAVRWTPQTFYFAARVRSDYSGDAGSPVYNDGVELYVSGSSPPTPYYTANDHHYILDHNGQVNDYETQAMKPSLSGYTSAVQKVTGGFDVEMSVDRTALGLGTLGGNILGFDVQMNDGDGRNQVKVLVWGHEKRPCGPGPVDASATCCGAGDGGLPYGPDRPWCNPRSWGSVELIP